jgi:hypothetical protein
LSCTYHLLSSLLLVLQVAMELRSVLSGDRAAMVAKPNNVPAMKR